MSVDVGGFDVGKFANVRVLRRIAEVSGGDYFDARTAADLNRYVDAYHRLVKAQNEAYSCLLRAGNSLYQCQLQQSNDAYAEVLREQNERYGELLREQNERYGDLLVQANDARSGGTERRARPIDARRRRLVEQLEARPAPGRG